MTATRIKTGNQVQGGAGSFTTFLLDQTTDKAAFIFSAEDNDTITHVGFRPSALNGTATTWKISLQGVSATAPEPDGAVLGGGTPASTTFTNSSLTAGSWVWLALDNSYPISAGESISVVIEYSSGTIGAGTNDLTVSMRVAIGEDANNARFYTTNAAGAGWSASSTQTLVVGIKSSTRAYGTPLDDYWSVGWDSADSPNVRGSSFKLMSELGSTYQVAGVFVYITNPSGTGNSLTFRIYDSDETTILQNVTIDSDSFANIAQRRVVVYFDESTLADLSFGTKYFFGIYNEHASQTVQLKGWQVGTASDFDAWDGQQNYAYATFNGSTWTETTTQRIFFELIITDVVGASGGSNVFVINE